MNSTSKALLSACALALASSCTQNQAPPPNDPAGITKSAAAQNLNVTEIATGLDHPWGLAVLPDGAMLVTERAGRLRLIRDGKLVDAPIAGVPAVLDAGQGGLLDIALHPDFATNNLVYLSYSKGTSNANHTAIVRGTFDGTRLTNIQNVFDATPDRTTQAHYGGRMLFMPDKTLILTLGDGYAYKDKAQTLDNDHGKIVRLTDTGQSAPDNPFIGQAGARAEIYSYGHRNVQGIAFDSSSNRLYAHEHGPKGGDEINLIQSGKNYGWPVITYGVDYSGVPISLKNKQDGMEQPLTYWVPSIAPSGMAFYSGAMFPAWRGDLIVTALAGQHIRRVDIDNGRVVGQEIYLADRNERYRHVVQAPDGALLVLTDNDEGKVLRLTPGS